MTPASVSGGATMPVQPVATTVSENTVDHRAVREESTSPFHHTRTAHFSAASRILGEVARRVWLFAFVLVGCGRIGFERDVDAGGVGDAATPDGSVVDADVDGGAIDASPDGGLLDDAGFCDESPCRLVAPQCGCLAGAACYPAGTGARCALPGTTPVGEPCLTHLDCLPGLGCVANAPDPTVTRLCRRLCLVGLDCPSGTCATGSVERAGVCTDECDPLTDTGCSAGLSCYLITVERVDDMATVRAAACAEAGTAADGEPCDEATRCQGGLVCDRDTMTCVPLCELGSTCPSPYTFCSPSGLFIDDVEVGVCRL
jgi:hypothetical protein